MYVGTREASYAVLGCEFRILALMRVCFFFGAGTRDVQIFQGSRSGEVVLMIAEEVDGREKWKLKRLTIV